MYLVALSLNFLAYGLSSWIFSFSKNRFMVVIQVGSNFLTTAIEGSLLMQDLGTSLKITLHLRYTLDVEASLLNVSAYLLSLLGT